MATTFLPNKNVGFPALNDTGWGLTADASFENIDSAFGANQTFVLSAASGIVAVSGTSFNGPYPANTASYIPLSWTLSGTLTANVNLQIPAGVGGQWYIVNSCTQGAFSITFSTVGGSTSATLNLGVQTVLSDGAGSILSTTGYLPIQASFRGTWPGTQSVGVSTFTVLNYNPSNTPSWGSFSGGTMTISQAGIYVISAAVAIQAIYSSAPTNPTKIRAGIYLNGNALTSVEALSDVSGIFLINLSTIISSSPADTINIQAYVYNTNLLLLSAATFNAENTLSIVKIA